MPPLNVEIPPILPVEVQQWWLAAKQADLTVPPESAKEKMTLPP